MEKVKMTEKEEIKRYLSSMSLLELYSYRDEAKESYEKAVDLTNRTAETLKKAVDVRKLAYNVYSAIQEEINSRISLL